jgi:hypothetical protein
VYVIPARVLECVDLYIPFHMSMAWCLGAGAYSVVRKLRYLENLISLGPRDRCF